MTYLHTSKKYYAVNIIIMTKSGKKSNPSEADRLIKESVTVRKKMQTGKQSKLLTVFTIKIIPERIILNELVFT